MNDPQSKELRRLERIRRFQDPAYVETFENRPTRKLPVFINPHSGFETLGTQTIAGEAAIRVFNTLLEQGSSMLEEIFFEFSCNEEGDCTVNLNQDHLHLNLKDELDKPVVAYLLNDNPSQAIYAERHLLEDQEFWMVTKNHKALLQNGQWGDLNAPDVQHFHSALDADKGFELAK